MTRNTIQLIGGLCFIAAFVILVLSLTGIID